MALPYFALKFLPNQLGSLPRQIRIEKQVDRLVLSLYAWAFSGPSYSWKVRLMDFLPEVSWTWRKPSLVQIQAPGIYSYLRLAWICGPLSISLLLFKIKSQDSCPFLSGKRMKWNKYSECYKQETAILIYNACPHLFSFFSFLSFIFSHTSVDLMLWISLGYSHCFWCYHNLAGAPLFSPKDSGCGLPTSLVTFPYFLSLSLSPSFLLFFLR